MPSANLENIIPQGKECSINSLAETMLKLDVTGDNYDELYRLESLLKRHEDEVRAKRQMISYKLRRYYQDQYLELNKNKNNNDVQPSMISVRTQHESV